MTDHDATPDPGESGVEHTSLPAQRSHAARNAASVVGVLLVALIALLALGGPGTDAASSRLIDRRVPDVSGATIDGGTYDIDAARGRWVLVNFFATWCAGCIDEHPELVELERWGQETGDIEIVSVVFQDRPEDVAALFDQLGGSWPVLGDSSLAVTFQVAQIPESFLVDPNGVVVAHAVGGVQADDIKRAIGGA